MANGGFSIDNETLVITVIVGIGIFYYFNHEVQTEEEVDHKHDDDRKNMAISNLDILTSRYDALNIEEHEGAAKLSQFADSALTAIVDDLIRLDAEARQIKGIGEDFFEKTGDLIRSGRYHLESHAKHVADEEAHKAHAEIGVCPTENKTVVTNLAVVHNHFDQRKQSVNAVQLLTDARSVVQQQAIIDKRHTQNSVHTTHTFNQQNNELKQLNINNPHRESRGPDTIAQGETPLELLTHVTTAEPSGNQSIADQQQNNRDNRVIVRANAVMGCGPKMVANRPTAANVLEEASRLSDLSSEASRRSKEIADRAGQMRGAGVIAGSVRAVDIFNSAPALSVDNHDNPPGAAVVSVPGSKGGASKALPGVGDEDMFDESGKADKGKKRKPPARGTELEGSPKKKKKIGPMMLKKIPISPLAVRVQAAKVEIGEFNAKIQGELDKLRAVTKYNPKVSGVVEALILKLDKAMHVGGTKGQKDMYKSKLRPGYVRRLNDHKKRFGINQGQIKSRYM